MKNFLLLASLFCAIAAIGQYDFNACRISNCNAEEINCISDEATCFNSYATLRTCMAACSDSKDWNSCWASCKNAPARSDSLYLSLSLCYENLCQVFEHWIHLAVAVLSLLLMI